MAPACVEIPTEGSWGGLGTITAPLAVCALRRTDTTEGMHPKETSNARLARVFERNGGEESADTSESSVFHPQCVHT